MPASFAMPAPLRAAIDAELASLRTTRTEASARRLSDRYLADRPATAPILVTDDDAAAYLTTRMPATFAAIGLALEQLHDAVPSFAPTALLDLGSGTGAATWAAWEVFETLTQARLEDYSKPALDAAQRMLESTDLTVTTRLADAAVDQSAQVTSAAPAHPVDLALSCYVLSELTETQRSAVVNRLMAAAIRGDLGRESGAVVVVEPGTPAGYQRILAVRDQLLAAGWAIAAPCPHQGLCPVSTRPGDWCHAAVRLDRSRAHRQAKGGERGYEDEKFAYVAAVRGLPLESPAARVLRHPITRPGHITLDLCRDDGSAALATISKRDGSAFRAARKVEWGEAWLPHATHREDPS